MSHGGAQPGNKHAAKAKAWTDALRKALVQYEGDGVPQGQALFKIAERVVIHALAGDKDAWSEIGNRLDGKPLAEGKLEVAHRVAESLTEEHARLVAEGYLESLRRSGGGGSTEPDRVHDGVSPGLPSG